MLWMQLVVSSPRVLGKVMGMDMGWMSECVGCRKCREFKIKGYLALKFMTLNSRPDRCVLGTNQTSDFDR